MAHGEDQRSGQSASFLPPLRRISENLPVPGHPTTVRRHPHSAWQRLPWDLLFWLATASLTSVASYLTTEVEMHRNQINSVDETARLADGDMVDVLVILNGDEMVVGKGSNKGGARAKVRMLGIRSFDPVVNEFEITSFGRSSVAVLENWILGHEVKLIFDRTSRDVHGRYLAYVERDGVDVNRHMVEEGLAMVYTEYPFTREAAFLSSESMARSARRGIWGGVRAVRRIDGLRRDWAHARQERTGAAFADPLLVP